MLLRLLALSPDVKWGIYQLPLMTSELNPSEYNYCSSAKDKEHELSRLKICSGIRDLLGPNSFKLLRHDDGSLSLKGSKIGISASHKESSVAVAINSKGPVGIDLEEKQGPFSWTAFQGRFFNQKDIITGLKLASSAGISHEESFRILFSAKESMLKLTRLKKDALEFEFLIGELSAHSVSFHDENTKATTQVYFKEGFLVSLSFY